MHNAEVKQLLIECRDELVTIQAYLTGIGDGARPAPYVKKYAVIRATGSIEAGFKRIIADRVDHQAEPQLRNFVACKIRNSSCNPKLGMIQNMLSDFDDEWRSRFDEKIALADQPRLKGALTTLVNARNSFAHGGVEELPIDETIDYFDQGRIVLSILDETLYEEIRDGV